MVPDAPKAALWPSSNALACCRSNFWRCRFGATWLAFRQASARRPGWRWFKPGISARLRHCIGQRFSATQSISARSLAGARTWRGTMRTGKRRLVPGPTKRGPVVPAKVARNITTTANSGRNHTPNASYQVRTQLENLLSNKDLPASARVTAARTLAEIEGLIGRHQSVPERTGQPISSLSRSELVAELERLRTLFGLGLLT